MVLALAMSSCSKDAGNCESHPRCDGMYNNVVVINHSLTALQRCDDQGNPAETIQVGGSAAGNHIRVTDGRVWNANPDCECTVHHIW